MRAVKILRKMSMVSRGSSEAKTCVESKTYAAVRIDMETSFIAWTTSAMCALKREAPHLNHEEATILRCRETAVFCWSDNIARSVAGSEW